MENTTNFMEYQVPEPTIEFAQPVIQSDIATVSPEVQQPTTKEPFMVYQVPEPTIEMPQREMSNSVDEINYDKYLDYQDSLLDKYGTDWARNVSEDEKREYIILYCNSHEATEEDVLDKFAPQEGTGRTR